MVAVVYSGSKNSFWRLSDQGIMIAGCDIPSLNPNFNDQKHLLFLLNKTNSLINHAESIKKIYAFVAGATTKIKQNELKESLEKFFTKSRVKVKDDLTGAAIAACQTRSGIVGILGSVANCAFFNGKKIKKNNYGLGYILGDEGSATHLGKLLLKNYLELKMPADLRKKIYDKYGIERSQALEKIYRKRNVQAYLSSFMDFIVENKSNPYIKQLIDFSFEKYFVNFLLPTVQKHPGQPVHFVGSVAGSLQENLHEQANKHHITITSIIKEPIYNLLNFYS